MNDWGPATVMLFFYSLPRKKIALPCHPVFYIFCLCRQKNNSKYLAANKSNTAVSKPAPQATAAHGLYTGKSRLFSSATLSIIPVHRRL
jgi:hypothetical protein